MSSIDPALTPASVPAPPIPSRWARCGAFLRLDTVGGALLLAATAAALIAANTGAVDLYNRVRDFTLGPAALHLDLSVAAWAADGLLAIFFFVVGLELKTEFVTGKLRNPRAAIVPIVAATAGVVIPALVYLAVASSVAGASRGWAIPAATDIAFAVAVIAVAGRFLPPALRTFLLTLAVVDDLLAITIIAVFYSDSLAAAPLLLALLPLALFAVAVQRGVRSWWVLLPLAFAVWALVHAGGVHATVAGVLLGFAVPVRPTRRAHVQGSDGKQVGLAHHFAHRWGLISTAVAVPVFAFFAAGVTMGGLSGLAESFTDPVALGVIAGLVIGKSVGITSAAWLLTRAPGITLDPTLRWPDIIGMSFVAGIGFTVSLLVGELSFPAESSAAAHVTVGVLTGSLLAAGTGTAILAISSRRYRSTSLLDRRRALTELAANPPAEVD